MSNRRDDAVRMAEALVAISRAGVGLLKCVRDKASVSRLHGHGDNYAQLMDRHAEAIATAERALDRDAKADWLHGIDEAIEAADHALLADRLLRLPNCIIVDSADELLTRLQGTFVADYVHVVVSAHHAVRESNGRLPAAIQMQRDQLRDVLAWVRNGGRTA